MTTTAGEIITLRVGFGHKLAYGGVIYSSGDRFEGPVTLLLSGLVLPADGDWRGIVPGKPGKPAEAPPEPAETPPSGHPPCDPGPRPAKHRGALQTCPVDGCPCLTHQGRCRAHARTSANGRAYATGHRNVGSALHRRWEYVRRQFLMEHPSCECDACASMPEPLRPPATEVDHIDGLGLLGPRAFDPSNLQALTKAHHARKTAGESFGR